MYIHIGKRRIISDKRFIGIFNTETLKKSDLNSWILAIIGQSEKTVAIDANNSIISSNVSPFTVIQRTSIKKDIVWSRDNAKI